MTFKVFSGLLFIYLVFSCEISYVQARFAIRTPILFDPPKNVTTKGTKIIPNIFFEQKVDNFNPSDQRTWKQRYHINEDYYNVGSKPHVFLLLGGESEATEVWLNYGAWIKTAKQYGALLIYLEHRYYGVSQPFSDLSTENLQYLTVKQALQDTANFIQGINKLYDFASDVKWIVFGGSYAGNLAAWLREQYPDLVTGVMSSSAPLMAFLDFNEYLRQVGVSISSYNPTCTENIQKAYDQLEDLVSSCLEDTEVYSELDEMFQLCDSIETSEGNYKDLSSLYQYLTDHNFALVVQYNGLLDINISTFCSIMTNDTGGLTELQRMTQVNSLILQYEGKTCTDYKYANLVAALQNTTIDSSSMMRQWLYQTCTEFGYFRTSSQQNPIFGYRFDTIYFIDLCVDVFGEEFNDTRTKLGIEATNAVYGGKNIARDKIVYFYGTEDPWHALGKLTTFQEIGDTVIIVDGVAHCANMAEDTEKDSEDLRAAKNEIDNLIGQWLGMSPSDARGLTNDIVSFNVLSLMWIIFYLLQ